MLLIVAHHYVVNSGLTEAGGMIFSNPTTWRSIFLLLFGAWGKTGINCFVFITGYFMCTSRITAKKFAKLILEIGIYKIVFYLLFLLTGYESFSFIEFVKMILPVGGFSTDFISCYLLFYFCIPFLNILIRNMTEKQHLYLVVLVSFIYILLGTVPKISVTMNYVTWFCVLYFISSYIRLYPKKLFDNTRLWGIMIVASAIISTASVVGILCLSALVGRGGSLSYYFLSDSNKILAVVTALCAFLFFKNVKIKQSKFINTVAASTFGVLCIHANSDTMRQWLWRDTLNNVGAYGSKYLVIHAVGSVIAIFTVCVCIDQVRILLLEMPFFRLWDKKWEYACTKYKTFERKLFKRLNVKE